MTDRQNIEMAAANDTKQADIDTEKSRRSKPAMLLGHSVVVTPEDDKRILRAVDLRILPIILVVYCLQSLDKTSLAYVSVFGLIQDTNLKGQEYSWLGAIVYVAQLIWQPVIAYFLVKFPIGKFIGVMVLLWGATLCCMAAAKDFGGLMATRFLLGTFEASVAPTFVAIVQMWYRRAEQTNRNAAWYSMLGVVNVLGSLLTYGLGHINSSSLRPYQIVFLFCGAITVAFAFVVIIFLPDSPVSARFFKGDDKLKSIERLRMNQQGISSGQWRWDHCREAALDLKTWLWFCLITAIAIPSGGITTFGPLIVKTFGYDSFQTILFNMPFGAVQFVATLGSAWAATHWKMKSPLIAGLCIPPIVGISILMAIPHNADHRAVLLFAYYITSVYPAISPLIYSWSGANTAGDTKRKVTTAVLFIGQSVGNIIGPNLYKTTEAPGYARGLKSNLAMFVLVAVLAGAGAGLIFALNKKHERERVRVGKAAKVEDLSMATDRHLRKEGEAVNQLDAGGVGERAFEDLGDLSNEDFIYVY
ncbi:MFS transporter-like protein 166 [Elsinoe australis]|uniref:MFS transporter-like protein 166 n=1 Tax=Elsinoe australis TaxID=40998 RepID=A0A4U7ALW7_9PEZI|nr:MFS transporter-like protein 166 [Elsinoe australis]